MEAEATSFVFHDCVFKLYRGDETVDLDLRLSGSKVKETIAHADIYWDKRTKRL